MKIVYRNTDLVLYSKLDLSPIVQTLGRSISINYHGKLKGRDFATFSGDSMIRNPDKTMNKLCALIERLPKKARSIWKKCELRVLDMGFDSGRSPHSFEGKLSPQTIARAAKLGFGITVTIYPLSAKGRNRVG